MRTTATLIIATLLLAVTSSARAADALATDDDKILYVMGQMLSRQLGQFGLSEKELAAVTMGLTDGVLGKEKKADPETYGPKIAEFAKARMSAAAEGEKKKGTEFLAKAAAEKGVEKLPSGVLYQQLAAGTGDSPKPEDKVKVNYRGTLIDGTEFDSSYKRNQPAEFPLNGVIKCWTEGVGKMKKGGKAKLICPSDVAYGDRGAPPSIKPGSTLIFEVELLEITPAPAKADAPAAGDKPADKPADKAAEKPAEKK